ncbi:uncharacterized protein HMPREF1541_09682 [Cyphellophora europaea CBS 101466]|uniref:DUF1308 domain-containing protein n=1 Tax=Cyphellophora europaea (strain CBS 101466) TaxID=1220924 RepID=W2S804_CYPE1|nr:uncharacterized protein HMPREF1541_09682 [Cyphellophora europaea CBS 101466]ETN44807.1 hypothetical protein HMPREF1541_09682 [Cyphellophora europaea CBS 101466]
MSGNQDSFAAVEVSSIEALEALHARATRLLSEFQSFNDYLREKGKQDEVEMRIFRRGLQAECDGLDKVISGKLTNGHNVNDVPEQEVEGRRALLVKTSNVSHYEIWWSLAKTCRGVRGLGRRIGVQPSSNEGRSRAQKQNQVQGQEVQVDIIADDGQEWIKISTVSEKRLLFEMAKEGWERYDDSSDSEASSAILPKLELLRLAGALHAAARTTRVRYQHPRIHFILPNLPLDAHPDVSVLLTALRATGATVSSGSIPLPPPAAPLADAFTHMLPSPPHQPPLTPSLSLDTSILIALLSDQCHTPPSELSSRPLTTSSHTYHAAIQQQMAQEETSPLLPGTLYPLLCERSLVCTQAAAARARDIVDTMGTESERARAEVVLGEGPCAGKEGGELTAALQDLSTYALPVGLRLPVRVVGNVGVEGVLDDAAAVPAHPGFPVEVAWRLVRGTKLSALNESVLLHGWREGVVTVTSNGVAVGQVERGINAVLDEMERVEGRDLVGFVAPMYWVVQESRSLVGKEKQGRGAKQEM